ncbi:anhydro-N-acetylmuramic acid kinase [Saccharobesus litoralis]|uniref:Anhydro-N-acetylmuramic acid kinase n=1 Tax=Saccharobesus litoralis TaxID=2172099 RepID=A0A2S0VS05_9ALTE|nr:anhydro-N-acetylmuramic acid kinase [Saccharobesus litoralis]AWB66973.1 anhydro-N-acetylmuramic acid kinase [Saccharobesus litoralis]
MLAKRYIGIMSGTSADGIDVALCQIEQDNTHLTATLAQAFLADIRDKILTLCQSQHTSLLALGKLTQRLTLAYADAVNNLLKQENLTANDIIAIGCHGQTVYHQPNPPHAFSMQLLNPALLAAKTGIKVVHDFRSMDIALGGQGAPLVPLFHQSLKKQLQKSRDIQNQGDKPLVLLNIGGIANISIIEPQPLLGFDTGPGNVLMDGWAEKHYGVSFDKNGEIAAQGKVQSNLLKTLLNDDYFTLPPPKSTGREHFNLAWLEQIIANTGEQFAPQDVMATLCALSAHSISQSIRHLPHGRLLVFGGGSHNQTLLAQLNSQLANWSIELTEQVAIDGDFMEAMAFAWLAYRCVNQLPGNSPQVTGAAQAAICGSITLPPI